jgi:hypothetical protein
LFDYIDLAIVPLHKGWRLFKFEKKKKNPKWNSKEFATFVTSGECFICWKTKRWCRRARKYHRDVCRLRRGACPDVTAPPAVKQLPPSETENQTRDKTSPFLFHFFTRFQQVGNELRQCR